MLRRLLLVIFVIGLLAIGPALSGCAHLPGLARDSGATGPAAITGQITDEGGAILADASVTLSGPSISRHATTDIAGRFAFDHIPLGRYVVSASAAGFKSAKQTVIVEKEATVRVDLKLRM